MYHLPRKYGIKNETFVSGHLLLCYIRQFVSFSGEMGDKGKKHPHHHHYIQQRLVWTKSNLWESGDNHHTLWENVKYNSIEYDISEKMYKVYEGNVRTIITCITI